MLSPWENIVWHFYDEVNFPQNTNNIASGISMRVNFGVSIVSVNCIDVSLLCYATYLS